MKRGNLPSTWQITTLEAIARKDEYGLVDGPFGSNLRSSEYVPAGVPVIRGSNLSLGTTRFDDGEFVYVSEETALRLKRSLCGPDDIIFTKKGTLGQTGIIPHFHRYKRFLVSSNQMKLSVDPDIADPLFVYYYVSSPASRRKIVRDSEATGVPKTNLAYLRTFPITLPSLVEQRAIAHILDTLDKKIELNHKMNHTLEAIARAIFKSWFVDFDPVWAKMDGEQPYGMDAETAVLFPATFEESDELGLIPKGWQVEALNALCEVTIGGDWGKSVSFEESVEVVCLRGVDLEHLRVSGWANAPRRWIKQSSLHRRQMNSCDVLIAASGVGPCGRPLWVSPSLEDVFSIPIMYSNFCKRFRTQAPEYAVYLDRVLLDIRESGQIWEYASGTAIPNLDHKGLLSGYQLVIPPFDILRAFYELMIPIYQKLYSPESRTLVELRDTLLPKLISGQLRVPDAEKFVVEST